MGCWGWATQTQLLKVRMPTSLLPPRDVLEAGKENGTEAAATHEVKNTLISHRAMGGLFLLFGSEDGAHLNPKTWLVMRGRTVPVISNY